MSYGDEPTVLDLTGIHLASLTGDNGNGKSALLDAMTYALWGKTRASGAQSSGEDDLVRLGADDMEAIIEFQIGESTYRAGRKRNRRTRTGDWQLHILDESGTWQPAGGASMAETGRHLTRLLQMEYETFLNSAYIQQGRADEFTRQKPNDRKRILGDILGLGRYERLEEMARERRTESDLALRDIEGELRHLEARAAEAAPVQERLNVCERDTTDATLRRDACTVQHQRLATRLSEIETRERQVREMELLRREQIDALTQIDGQIARTTANLDRSVEFIAQAATVRSDVSLLDEMRRSIELLEPALQKLAAAREQRAALQSKVDHTRQALLREIDQVEAELRRIGDVESRIAETDGRLEDIARQLSRFSHAASERQKIYSALTRATDTFTEMAAQSRGFKHDINEVEEVIELLSEPKPACPVCSSDLSGGRQQAVLVKQRGLLEQLKLSLAKMNRAGAATKRERDSLQSQLDTLDDQIRSESTLRARRAELLTIRERLVAQLGSRDDASQELESLRCRVDAGDYALDERRNLGEVEEEITRSGEDAKAHAAATAILRELTGRQVEKRLAELEQAERTQVADRRELERLCRDRDAQSVRLESHREKFLLAQSEIAGIEEVRIAVQEATARLNQASSARELSLGQVERLRQILEDCLKAAEQVAKRQTERERLAKDKQAYTDLAAAFSKRGVQAHIIDNALPDIEDEANRLLAKLTDNALQIKLSTLRQARTGSNQIETLDISITDEAGARPYEMYSGGEAFRVNFALRIALSRLLARRAGANLQTLILDEGFGTQDAKGRERLVEAIEAVKDEFSLILVISHIEELKDAFPTRIEITKTPLGSQIIFAE